MNTVDLMQRAVARVVLAALAAVLALVMVTPAAPADAAVLGARAVSYSAAQKGKPYVWGSSGPKAFDCSGLVAYVYNKKLGKKLPRTAAEQKRATRPVSKRNLRLGDLIFFYSGRTSNVYHVGVYAGAGKLWHAPKPGDRVKLSTLWTSKWTAGRVR